MAVSPRRFSFYNVDHAEALLNLDAFFCVVVACAMLGSAQVGAAWQISNRVIVEHGALSIDHSKGVKEITAAQAKGGFKADHGVGLFQNRIKTELAFVEVTVPGKHLSSTTRIATSPVIYVARELPQDSCAYQLVLGHELQHQEYDLEVLRAMPDEIRNFSQEVFDTDAIERSGGMNQNQARSRFFQQFNFVYKALGEMRHPVIDSPESYRRLSGLCNGELAKYLPAGPAPKSVAKKGK
jgi:hypothetical protein